MYAAFWADNSPNVMLSVSGVQILAAAAFGCGGAFTGVFLGVRNTGGGDVTCTFLGVPDSTVGAAFTGVFLGVLGNTVDDPDASVGEA